MTTYNDPEIGYASDELTFNGLPDLFDGVFVLVQAAFGYAPLDTAISWTSLTSKVRAVNIKRGKQSQFSEYGAATCQVTLSNNDRRFDPLHTSGPYYGNLNPMVPIRVLSQYDGNSETLFYGFAQTWQTDYQTANNDNVCTVQCVDLNRILSNSTLPQNALYGEYTAKTLVNYWTFDRVYAGDELGSYGAKPQVDDYESGNPLIRVTRGTDAPVLAPTYQADRPVGSNYYAPAYDGDWWRAYTGTGFPYAMQAWFDTGEPHDSSTWEWGIANVSGADKFQAEMEVFPVQVTGVWYFTIKKPLIQSTALGIDHTAVNYINQTLVEGVNNLGWTLFNDGGVWKCKLFYNGTLIDTTTLNTGTPTLPGNTYSYIDADNPTINESANIGQWVIFGETLTDADFTEFEGAANGYTDTVHGRADRVLDWAGIPSGWRDIDTNTSGGLTAYRPQGAQVSSYLGQLSTADGGDWFVNKDGYVRFMSGTTLAGLTPSHTFGAGGLPFTNVKVTAATIDNIVNHVIVRVYEGEAESEDSTSVAAYGRSTETLSVTTIDSKAKAKSIANARVAARKDPQTEVRSLALDLRSDIPNLWPALAGMDLDEAVTVTFTPNDVGTAISQDARVQGLSHTITPAAWKTQVYLGGLS